MAAFQSFVVCLIVAFAVVVCADLCPDFYAKVCPDALPTIRSVVQNAINREPRIGASLLRLHFHDCFVNGCDGSVLLDDTTNFIGEKTAFPNFQSLNPAAFDVVDEIKIAVNKACGYNVVSCADILAVAARDSIDILGGYSYYYKVLLGRRDARNASRNDANNDLPSPLSNFTTLLSNFHAQGLNLKDLVALSGGHSIGLARCIAFRGRIYNDTNINPAFKASRQQQCPLIGGDNNTESLDATPTRFDTVYFRSLIKSKGLLHSDQELFKGDGNESDKLVQLYSTHHLNFARDFAASIIKMGNIKPLTGNQGEVRLNCRKVN